MRASPDLLDGAGVGDGGHWKRQRQLVDEEQKAQARVHRRRLVDGRQKSMEKAAARSCLSSGARA